MKRIKHVAILVLALLPMGVMAHPGHEYSHSSFWSGFIHPFTGLDHLMMALAFGVLIWTSYQRWKIAGCIGLSLAMMAGFMLGTQQLLSAPIAEYGIAVSLMLLAVALWTKAYQILPVIAIVLASFHGVAHGMELGQSGQATGLMLGMVAAMTLIYGLGLALGAVVGKYVPYGKQVIGACAAVIAVLGFA